MSEEDRSTQHSANGVGGSNDPASNPGQDRPAKPQDDQVGQNRPEAGTGDSDQKGQSEPDAGGQR